jgi:hypothetical protein
MVFPNAASLVGPFNTANDAMIDEIFKPYSSALGSSITTDVYGIIKKWFATLEPVFS